MFLENPSRNFKSHENLPTIPVLYKQTDICTVMTSSRWILHRIVAFNPRPVNTFPWSTRHTPWRPLHPAEPLKSLIMPLKYGQCKYSSGLSLACPHALCTTKHKVSLWLGVQFWKPSWCRGLCKLKAISFMKLNKYIKNLSGNQTILTIILTFYSKFQATIIPLSFKTWNIFMWTFSITKTLEITSYSSVHNSWNILYMTFVTIHIITKYIL